MANLTAAEVVSQIETKYEPAQTRGKSTQANAQHHKGIEIPPGIEMEPGLQGKFDRKRIARGKARRIPLRQSVTPMSEGGDLNRNALRIIYFKKNSESKICFFSLSFRVVL